MRALKPLLSSSFLLRGIPPLLFGLPFCSPLQGGRRDDLDCIRVHGHRLSSVVGTIREFESDQPCDDEKVTKKEAALHLALSQLVGDFDRDSNLSLHRFYSSRYAPVISTGSLKLDQALGIGGLPKGRMV
ncbi:DNA repair protein recA homolog 2, mitochondrial-like [Dioscorea cayenensis subsp. rotundata]|uniref:DNA repair protein recA homolog 2, mitochondrial-like n=1 Tax=Dioscorea cayennensis subsp. rotundata TaxID=55577 RepID=A0AB40BQQ5_DIOCR|nr:DNA repair protein recA homolog 2, mitochondrial-like [Dioscorea cayenensis subsp. rotundata]